MGAKVLHKSKLTHKSAYSNFILCVDPCVVERQRGKVQPMKTLTQKSLERAQNKLSTIIKVTLS